MLKTRRTKYRVLVRFERRIGPGRGDQLMTLTVPKRVLQDMLADPDDRSRLPLVTNAERERLLFEWNDTYAEYPRDRCVHELFEEQAGRTPDTTAVVFENQELSYRELNSRSNQLAHHLLKLGVG